MKIFLINLDKDSDRLASSDAQLKNLKVEYVRFPAVYAKELPKNDLDRAVNHFRFKCCVGRNVWTGEIGCALSHHALYKLMIEHNIPYMCILEDDVVLADDFNDALSRVEKNIDSIKPQVYLLSNYTSEIAETPQIRKVSLGYCTDGYVITKPAAEAILKENSPICVPCDHWGRWVKHKKIELYSVLPPVCSQNNTFDTTIPSNGETQFKDKSVFEKIKFITLRICGKSIDWILYKMNL